MQGKTIKNTDGQRKCMNRLSEANKCQAWWIMKKAADAKKGVKGEEIDVSVKFEGAGRERFPNRRRMSKPRMRSCTNERGVADNQWDGWNHDFYFIWVTNQANRGCVTENQIIHRGVN